MADNSKIFERVGDMVYERKIGESVRELTQTSRQQAQARHDEMMDNQMWYEIRRDAKTNTALQAALDHAIMIYKLSKEYNNGI